MRCEGAEAWAEGWAALGLRTLTGEPEPLRDLADGGRAPRECPPRAPAEPGGYRADHGGPGRCGRLTVALPSGRWEERWRRRVPGGLAPVGLRQSRDRILVLGRRRALFAADGTPLGTWPGGGGGACLDPERGLIYGLGPGGDVELRAWEDGALARRLRPPGGAGDLDAYLFRRGPRLLLAGPAADAATHEARWPPAARVVAWELPRSLGADANPTPGGGEEKAADTLCLRAGSLCAAGCGETLFLAWGEAFAVLGADGVPEGVYAGGSLRALALSCDGVRRAYLALEREDALELWVLVPGGARVLRAGPWPLEPTGLAPPLVSYGGAIALCSRERLRLLTVAGRTAWERQPPGGVAGAVWTSNERLLVAEGTRAVAYDLDGKARLLWAGEEPLRAPPVVTAEGDLLLLDRTHLRCCAVR
ncbi:MAG: hypothetical protein D6731_12845 [Planctomycetota bacterium]|nr:MAG: hypothetical protein D6731_12845 [Planctomycetota bacterium]